MADLISCAVVVIAVIGSLALVLGALGGLLDACPDLLARWLPAAPLDPEPSERTPL